MSTALFFQPDDRSTSNFRPIQKKWNVLQRYCTGSRGDVRCAPPLVLELELVRPHMAQKPVLRGEVGCACVAREVSVERGGMGERGCARRWGGWVWV